VTHAEPLIALAAVTRQRFCAQLGLILPKVAQDVRDQLNQRLEAARAVRDMQSARDILSEFERSDRSWIDGIRASLQQRLNQRESHSTRGQTVPGRLELLADEAVEDQLLAQRLAARIQDASSQDLTDLRLRLLFAEGRLELAPTDVVRPETIGRILLDEWVHAGLSRDAWQQLSGGLSNSVATKLVEAYREANRFLITNGVMPEIDLKNAVRKAPSAPGTANAASGGASGESPAHVATQAMPHPGAGTPRQRQDDTSFAPTARVDAHAGQTAGSGGEWWSKARAQTQEVMGRIKRLFADQGAPLVSSLPAEAPHASPSPRLNALLQPGKLQGFSQVEGGGPAGGVEVTPAQMDDYIHVMRQRSSELKQAAESPSEKAIIEIVALMFQSILAEDRIQASLRVWFARLQIPVLRVALSEPDFFSTLQHPARRLIDRMGSCALGFDANMSEVSAQALEVEIRRVVQVIEQYPETGRRVFQLAYDEFQSFLAKHLQSQGPAGKLVSIAQQVELKETLTVQYTIELRKQLNDMPVRDDIRDFLFKVWAEVLAVASIKFEGKPDIMAMLKSTASDLLWAASAKPSRAERAQVIAQLPNLLTRLRKGMAMLGMDTASQDQQIKRISDILADAFMSRTETIPADQLAEVTRNLSSLEDFLPEDGVGDLDLDQDSIEMITGVDASHIVVIAQGGEAASQAMRAWALELQLGAWFRLDHNNNPCQVQFAWRSNRGQLYLFATAQQQCFLIQTARVASYLQAGLLVPVEEESLTVRATRAALEKLDANPERLLT
jgi:hypothetical protein